MASYSPYVLLVIALAFSSAAALQCYSCNSGDSATCKWGLTSFTYNVDTCGSAGILDGLVGAKCYKITAKNKEGTEHIARGCLNPPALGCQTIAKSIGWISEQTRSDSQAISNIDCVTCDTDKCNSASKIAGFTLFGVLLAIFAFMF
ncbi:uncharacterized protein [Euwallacea fornicatus]|uniref:uncharacterized protein n=1 Tax=Euwallacea fornicatus TaxID=995702 RepID=UPI00338EF61E